MKQTKLAKELQRQSGITSEKDYVEVFAQLQEFLNQNPDKTSWNEEDLDKFFQQKSPTNFGIGKDLAKLVMQKFGKTPPNQMTFRSKQQT